MLIKNYGLFWLRHRIHWGAGRNKGHLKGVPAKNKTGKPVNFRYQQGVYALYDESFGLVYVGQVGRSKGGLLSRLKDHRTDHLSQRWSRFSWFGVYDVKDNRELETKVRWRKKPALNIMLNHIEGILIAVSEPPNNRQGGRFGEEVSQYLQYVDHENIYPDQQDMIKKIYDNIWNN